MRLFYHKRKLIGFFVLSFFVFSFSISIAYAQSIPITMSDQMVEVIFDGKWTFLKEWKPSSQYVVGNEIILRSAHQDNFIYLMLDVIQDKTINNNKDYAKVCFDTKNDQNPKPDDNDYCFMAKLGSDKAITLQGFEEFGEFKVIENHLDLIALGGTSDENDRYSKIPHATYEFKIPLELLGRTNIYGFYVEVFDFGESAVHRWPGEIVLESNSDIPSPAKWGTIYSPDKSLPEYDLPILVLLLGTFSIILFSWKNKKLNLSYLNR